MSGATINLPVSELMELKRKIDELEARVARSHGSHPTSEITNQNNTLNIPQAQNDDDSSKTSHQGQNDSQSESTTLSGGGGQCQFLNGTPCPHEFDNKCLPQSKNSKNHGQSP